MVVFGIFADPGEFLGHFFLRLFADSGILGGASNFGFLGIFADPALFWGGFRVYYIFSLRVFLGGEFLHFFDIS